VPSRPQHEANLFSSDALIADLQSADAYPYPLDAPVVLHETHVSWVFLAGDYAYKIKKPVETHFLDYSTLERREHFCHEEMRLDRRYTDDLYLGVVPITVVNDHAKVEGDGSPIEFAVKMRRFPETALLSKRIDLGLLTVDEVTELATAVASFHARAERWTRANRFATADLIAKDLKDCLDDLATSVVAEQTIDARNHLTRWADQFLEKHRSTFDARIGDGFVRECHGDLHLDNVVHLGDRLVPFDGIEFNDGFRWIDVLNDAAFLVMDFAARGHAEFGQLFLNAYLERTGDYECLALMRWYLVYRALVRAKVAAIRASQEPGHDIQPRRDCLDHVCLAERFARPKPLHLWITHGLSGSGKTTASEAFVADQGAIRLRSDLERKRLYQMTATDRADGELRDEMYSAAATERTYRRLRELAASILRGGFSVIVDATFLRQTEREEFHRLAEQLQVGWGIVHCDADVNVLRDRVAARWASQHDASDANLEVLERQIAEHDPLTNDEMKAIVHTDCVR
jgi:aminoglycoside phosphotransferase family enzyme/predicted kinase